MKRILDVGCGDRPRKEANFFVDRFPFDPKHRSGREIEEFPENFVVADADNLPFRDKVFDYCYCYHALEHMESPEEALREMDRVARAGRIQTPYWFYELVRRRFNHYWLVFKRGHTLVLLEKEEKEKDDMPLFWLFSLTKLSIEKALKKLGLWETDYKWKCHLSFIIVFKDGSAGSSWGAISLT